MRTGGASEAGRGGNKERSINAAQRWTARRSAGSFIECIALPVFLMSSGRGKHITIRLRAKSFFLVIGIRRRGSRNFDPAFKNHSHHSLKLSAIVSIESAHSRDAV